MNCVFFKITILIQAIAGQSYSQTALICTHFEQLGYFHMEAKSLPLWGGTVGQKGEVSQKFAKAYEFAFGSEVAETAERMQGTFWINMYLKLICEQNLIS